MTNDFDDARIAEIARGVNKAVARTDNCFVYLEDDPTEVRSDMTGLLETPVWGISGREYWGEPQNVPEWINALSKRHLYCQRNLSAVRETMSGV